MRSCKAAPEEAGSRVWGNRKQKPADAELVRRTLAGDVSAFDCLVLRHRRTVLTLARVALGDWDRAEDVAQQAFLEALAGLPGLRDGAKFKPWLATITRRCAARQRANSAPNDVEFCDAVLYPLHSTQPIPATDDLRERIRASLSELSARSRTVVTLHYLDGYSCREIGSRLEIPVGTVKRILHESRNSLRQSMGVAASVKGEPEMAVAGESKRTKTGPRSLVSWIYGECGPGNMMRGTLPQSVCLAVNKAAKGVEQIAKEVDANVRFVQEAIDPLVREEILQKTADGRYRANFLAFDAQDWIEVTRGVREQGVTLADALQSDLPALEEAWNRTTLPERGYPWQSGIWPALAIFVCNLAISRNSPPEPEPPQRDSGHRYWLGGHEAVPDEQVLWGTGFNGSSPDDLLAHGYFWTWGLCRQCLGYREERVKALTALAKGASNVDEISAQAGLSADQARETTARLVEVGVVERAAKSLKLTFPILTEQDSDVLTPVVDEVAVPLCSDILQPATADLAEKLRRAGYKHLEDQFAAWRRWQVGNIAGEGLRELLKRGVLPDPGDPAPANFCLIGWFGRPPLMSWKA